MIYQPHIYQDHATDHVMNNPYSGLFLEMGLGKTVATLTAINRLMYDELEIDKVLVIAPKRVAEDTWTTEASKWEHLKHLKLSLVLGTERERKQALLTKADIYVINRENVAWLVAHYGGAFPFDMLVIDELSSFKSAQAARFKSLRMIRPKIKRVVGLTGTPIPNGLLDLWPQMYLLDMGERLGKTLTSYREKYFKPGKRNGHIVYEYKLKEEDAIYGADIYQKEIYDKIGDICISMKAEDWLELPERIDQIVNVRLSPAIYQQYLDFEKKQILALEDLDDITAVNAAALTNKLLQFANGAVYSEGGEYYEVHNEKIEALAEDVEAANGKPILVFYQYKHDLARIQKYLRAFKPHKLEGTADIAEWNKGKIPFMLAHAASAGHGLNLQHGGHLMDWFGVPWSLELYLQAIARLDRQGQTERVINRRLIVPGTMDEDVIASLDRKESKQDAMMQAVKARIAKYRE